MGRQWILAGTVKDYLALSCTLKINDIGTASLSLRPDDHLAQWIMDTVDGDTGRSVFLTVDKNGIRWSGRLDTYTIDSEKSVFTAMFNDDMEQLKYVSIWPNPFLPATVQAPKYWTLFAPIDWAIPLTFFCQFLRLSGNLWNIPDDPLDPTTWVEGITPLGMAKRLHAEAASHLRWALGRHLLPLRHSLRSSRTSVRTRV